MRPHFLQVIACLLVLVAFPVKAADWSIEVVPNASGGAGKQRISIWHPFYVVLTNITDHNLMVWDERCSWGYFNLSFEFTDKVGKSTKVEKLPIGFTVNFPAGFVVLPGRHYVIPVRLYSQDKSDREWTNVGKLDGPMTVKAIYKCTNEAFPGVKPDPKNKEPDDWQKLIDSAWTGRVESEPLQVEIQR